MLIKAVPWECVGCAGLGESWCEPSQCPQSLCPQPLAPLSMHREQHTGRAGEGDDGTRTVGHPTAYIQSRGTGNPVQ